MQGDLGRVLPANHNVSDRGKSGVLSSSAFKKIMLPGRPHEPAGAIGQDG
jgi:hypothetical protein